MTSSTTTAFMPPAAAGAGAAAPAESSSRKARIKRVLPERLSTLIEEHVKVFGAKDALTVGIEEWYQASRSSLLRCPEAMLGATEKKCHLYLKLILRDRYTNGHLNEKALLGTDGWTYKPDTLVTYAASPSTPAERRNKSPCCPEDPREFQAFAHKVARYMVKWLKKRDEDFRKGTITTEERRLVLRAKKVEESERRKAAAEASAARAADEMRAQVAFVIDPMEENRERNHEQTLRAVEAARVEQAEAAQELDRFVDEFEAGIGEVAAEIPALRDEITAVERRTDAVEARTEKISGELDALKEAIEDIDKDKDPFEDVLKVVAVIAIAAATGWAAHLAIQVAAGGSSTIAASTTIIPAAKASSMGAMSGAGIKGGGSAAFGVGITLGL